MYRLGIDIGGTKINVGIVSYDREKADVVALCKLEVKSIDNVTLEIKRAVDLLCGEIGISVADIERCGVGIPGTVSRDGKRILKAPNIAILSEDFAGKLENALSLPVTMVQDSRAAAWGEYLCGGGKGAETLICMTLGTGIGTGIVIDGRVYNGGLGAAGELGHLPAVKDGRPCGCGKRGCLEKYCSGGGLDITARELLGDGKTARELFSEAKSGNLQAQKAIDDAAVLLGKAVVAAINLISPNVILFSGGMSKQEDFLDAVIAYVKDNCYFSGELPRLEPALLGELAPLVGASLCDL